jgi:hypothetical protein
MLDGLTHEAWHVPQSRVNEPAGVAVGVVGLREASRSQLAWTAALGLTILYGAVAITVSLLAFRARDITS